MELNNTSRLPTFIGIGAMKSGTTSLYKHLSSHPEIEMSVIKETDFFMKFDNIRANRAWYENNFYGNEKYAKLKNVS